MKDLFLGASLDELWTTIHRIQDVHQYEQERRILAAYVERWAPGGVRSVLDVGCGNGTRTRRLSREFQDARVVGVDINAGLIAEARRASFGWPVEFVAGDFGDALELPVADVDLIHVRCMLHLLDDAARARALGTIARLSRPGTIVFAIDYDTQLRLMYPDCSFLDRMRAIAAGLQERAGIDVEMGRKLPHVLAGLGFGDLRFELSCLDNTLLGPAEFFELMIAQARILMAHVPGALTERDLTEGAAELGRWLEAGGSISLGAACCVAGRKRAR